MEADMSTVDQTTTTALAEHMLGPVVTPEDPTYDEERRVWNGMIDRRPEIIAKCTGVADVIAAVGHAREQDLLVSIRGGGHNVAGAAVNDGGIVVDLSPMRGVRVDAGSRTVWVQAGATWADVDRATQLHGLAVAGGVVSETGVAGLALSGGVSSQRRRDGMTIDNLLAAEVVLADGRYVRASADEHPDLLWALRGGGGNFGVVTAFEFRAHPLGPDVATVNVAYPVEHARAVLRGYRDLAAAAPDEVTTEFLVWNLPDVPDLPPELRGRPFAGVLAMYAGPPEEAAAALQPYRELATPLVDMSATKPYLELQRELDPLVPAGVRAYWKSLYLDELTDEIVDALVPRAIERPSGDTIVVLRHMGGAIARVAPDATPFPDRHAQYMLSIDSMWTDPGDDAASIAWTREFWEDLRPYSGGRTYFNFDGELLAEDQDALRTSYGANYERLVDVKTRYDPGNLFRLNQNIKPR
jgi:FAD/FMN-containing dehydrogenase